MKKTLIALAAVAVTGVASAQVTLSGTMNADVQNTTADSKAAVAVNDAILSFSATEDMGGGMKLSANTTLQTKAGRGGTVTGNGYSIAMSGGFGTVTLKNYLNGGGGLSAGISASNDMNTVWGAYAVRTRLEYAAPTIVPGLTAAVRFDSTDTSVDSTDRATTKYALGYTMGALSVSTSGSDAAGSKNDYTVSYDAGIAKLAVYSATNHREYTVTAPVGAVNVGLHIAKGTGTDKTSATGFVASYALSKRTTVSYNYVNQSATAAGAAVGTNYRLRLGHSF